MNKLGLLLLPALLVVAGAVAQPADNLTVAPDQKTIYITDSINAKVVKLVHD